MGVPKLGLLLSQSFGCSYLSQIRYVLKIQGQYLIALKKIFSTMYNTPLLDLIWPILFKGFGVESQISNLAPFF